MKLYGRNPVLERLKSNPKSIKKIFLEEGQKDASYIKAKARQWGIPLVYVPRSKMIKAARSLNAQGLLVEIADFAYCPYEELLPVARQKNRSLVFLDGINDPQNLGSIIRGLACLGGFSLVLPSHDSVDVTEAVLRVASGADNFIAVAKVNNLSWAIRLAKDSGFWIAGTVVEGGKDLREISLPFPLALVMGSEQRGIRDVIKKQLDLELSLPMSHPRLSLNVAQAAVIFCYEISKQKKRRQNIGPKQEANK